MKEILSAGNEALHFVGAEDDGQATWTLRVRQAFLPGQPFEDPEIEDAERGQHGYRRTDRHPPILEQVRVIAPQVFRTHAVETLADVPLKRFEDTEITLAGRRRVLAPNELVVQTL